MTTTAVHELRIFTPDEAAERLRITKRKVITLGKRFGLCRVTGRTVLFTEKDLSDLVDAMRFKPVSDIGERYSTAWRSRNAYERAVALVEARRRPNQEKTAAAAAARAAARQVRIAEEARLREDGRAAKERARELKSSPPTAHIEELDRNNRDPAYWTAERKRRLRKERVQNSSLRAKEDKRPGQT